MSDHPGTVLEREDLIKPKRAFEDWFASLRELAELTGAYDQVDPADWREYYDSWYTPGEALAEDQSYG